MIRRYRRPVLVLAATMLIAIAAVAGLAVRAPITPSAQQLIAAKLASKDLRARVAGHRERRPGRRVRRAARRDAAVRQRAHRAGQRRRSRRLFGRLRQPAEPRDDRRLVERADRASRTTPTTRTTATSTPTRAAARASSPAASPASPRTTTATSTPRGADGGVWRSTTGGGNWTPIADSLPSLSSGDLELAPDGSLWYATGEANTGGTSYAGTRRLPPGQPDDRHVLAVEPRRRQRARVDDDQLDPVHVDRRRGSRRSAASSRTRSASYSAAVDAAAAAEPELPPGRRERRRPELGGHEHRQRPRDRPEERAAHPRGRSAGGAGGVQRLLRVDGRRASTWAKINPTGGLDATDIGYANFAYSSDGSKLYVINQSPKKGASKGSHATPSSTASTSPTRASAARGTSIASSDKLGATAPAPRSQASRARATARAFSPGTTSRSRSTRRTRTT